MSVRIAILTVSDGVHGGARQDGSGNAIEDWARNHGHTVISRAVVPDDADAVAAVLVDWCDSGTVDILLTTGGTGLTARDVTPEATRRVLEREAPGIAEAIRAAGRETTPYAALSRGLGGTRGATLIVNLPGSTGGVRDGLAVLAPLAEHAAQLLRGKDTERHGPHG